MAKKQVRQDNVTTRDHILDIAGHLFYEHGIRAIGVDTVVAQAKVAKTTLYDHFPSKDHLIRAYLEAQDAVFWEMFDTTLEQHAGDPRGQILAVFAMLEAQIATPQSLGCPFISAASEFPELDQPGHQVAIAHKQQLRERLAALAAEGGAASPALLADQLLLLLDGAFASKRVFRSDKSPAAHLSSTVALLLDVHLGKS
jgi:AcrR family transcriptional regulator